jgi:hypothetical protein
LEEHYKLGGLTPLVYRVGVQIGWKNITNWED